MTMTTKKLTDKFLRDYEAKHTTGLQTAIAAFCTNNVSDLDAKLIPTGVPCCNLATGTTTITPAPGTPNIVATRGLAYRPGTTGSASDTVPNTYLLVSALAGGSNKLRPFHNGDTCLAGIVQAPVVASANYTPVRYRSQSVGVTCGVSNVTAAVSGMLFNSCVAGNANGVSTFTAIRGPRRSPMGAAQAAFGPLAVDNLQPADTQCPVFSPSGSSKVAITDDVSPWYYKSTGIAWAGAGATATSTIGQPFNVILEFGLNPDVALALDDWLASISIPTMFEIDFSAVIRQQSTVVNETVAANFFLQTYTPMVDAAGAATTAITAQSRVFGVNFDLSTGRRTNINAHAYVILPPGCTRVVATLNVSPANNLMNAEGVTVGVRRLSYVPRPQPAVVLEALNSSSVTTVSFDAVWGVAPTVQNMLILGYAPENGAAGELELDVQNAIPHSYAKYDMLSDSNTNVIPIDESHMTPALAEVSSPAAPPAPSGTFLAGLLPGLMTAAKTALPLLSNLFTGDDSKPQARMPAPADLKAMIREMFGEYVQDMQRRQASDTGVGPVTVSRSAVNVVDPKTAGLFAALADTTGKKSKKKMAAAQAAASARSRTGLVVVGATCIPVSGIVPDGGVHVCTSEGKSGDCDIMVGGYRVSVVSLDSPVQGSYELTLVGPYLRFDPHFGPSATSLRVIGGRLNGETHSIVQTKDIDGLLSGELGGCYGVGVTDDGPNGGSLFQIFVTTRPITLRDDNSPGGFIRTVEYVDVGCIRVDKRLFDSFEAVQVECLARSSCVSGSSAVRYVTSHCNLDLMEKTPGGAASRARLHQAYGGSLMAPLVFALGGHGYLRGRRRFAVTGTPFSMNGLLTVVERPEDKDEILKEYAIDAMSFANGNGLVRPDSFGYMWVDPDNFPRDLHCVEGTQEVVNPSTLVRKIALTPAPTRSKAPRLFVCPDCASVYHGNHLCEEDDVRDGVASLWAK